MKLFCIHFDASLKDITQQDEMLCYLYFGLLAKNAIILTVVIHTTIFSHQSNHRGFCFGRMGQKLRKKSPMLSLALALVKF